MLSAAEKAYNALRDKVQELLEELSDLQTRVENQQQGNARLHDERAKLQKTIKDLEELLAATKAQQVQDESDYTLGLLVTNQLRGFLGKEVVNFNVGHASVEDRVCLAVTFKCGAYTYTLTPMWRRMAVRPEGADVKPRVFTFDESGVIAKDILALLSYLELPAKKEELRRTLPQHVFDELFVADTGGDELTGLHGEPPTPNNTVAGPKSHHAGLP